MYKKVIMSCGLVIGVCTTLLASSSQVCCKTGFTILNLSEVEKPCLESFFKGESSNYVLECPAGLVLPFTMSIKGEYLALDDDDSTKQIKILKTCFIRVVEGDFLFSADLSSWKTFGEFFCGQLGVGVCEDTHQIYLNLELNSKS